MEDKLARYRQKVFSLLAELESLPDAAVRRAPVGGGWSAVQTAQHLILSDELSLAYVRKKMAFTTHFERPSLWMWLRWQLLWLSLALPIKFRAPKNVAAEEVLPNDVSLPALRARWEKSLDEWAAFFASLPAELRARAVYRHPRAGRMSWAGMLGFFQVHFDRHLKQIRRATGG